MQIEHPLGEVQIRVMEARDINAVAVLLSRSFPSRDWQSVDNIRHDSKNVLFGDRRRSDPFEQCRIECLSICGCLCCTILQSITSQRFMVFSLVA
jgi:hypothetical protein